MTDEIKMLSRNPIYMFNYIKRALVAGNDIILAKIRNKEDGIRILNEGLKMNNTITELNLRSTKKSQMTKTENRKKTLFYF